MVDKELLDTAAKLAGSEVIANAIATTTTGRIASNVKSDDLVRLTAKYYKSLSSIDK